MSKLIAYVGRNHIADFSGGGISVFEVSKDGAKITPLEGGSEGMPKRAGFLAYAPKSGTLYAVDERKTDGRGPKRPASTVMSFRVDKQTGALTLLNKQPAIGANPASVCVGPEEKHLFTANHGFFDHVIKVIETADGKWVNSFVYDDSTVVQYPLNADGSIGEATDVDRLTGHGQDPNSSPQGGGHAQASPHTHIVVVDPSGKYLVVCEKAGERIYVYRLGGDRLVLASIYQCPLGTGPRHAAFDKNTGRMFMTCEFSSELWSFDFDAESRRAEVHRQAVHPFGLHGTQRNCNPANPPERPLRVHEQPWRRHGRLVQHLSGRPPQEVRKYFGQQVSERSR